jgi:LysM repeat protein
MEILNESQLIYLEKKPRKGTKDIHIVQENETLRDIAQLEGIQLSTIMEYNNLQKGMQPAKGEKIYLKYPAPVAPKLAAANGHKSVATM